MHKELLFSGQHRIEEYQAVLKAAGLARRLGPRGFDPASSALLVLDMQRYFLDPDSHAHVPSGIQIIPALEQLAAAFTRRARPVFYTQHINTPADAGQMDRWWRDLIAPDDPLAAITPEFAPDEVIVKQQYDAFYETDLHERLASAGVRQVVIGGVMTHLCCETTARAAFMRGLEVYFLLDGTAAYNRSFHQAALTNLSHGFAQIVTAAEIEEALA